MECSSRHLEPDGMGAQALEDRHQVSSQAVLTEAARQISTREEEMRATRQHSSSRSA